MPNPTRDYAAEALKKKQDDYRKTYPNADHDSLLWRVEQKDQAG